MAGRKKHGRPEWCDEFITSLRERGNVAQSARSAGITRGRTYQYRQEDPEFRQEWDDAIEEAADELEAEAWRRAVDGVEKPVFQGGKEVGRVREYSDKLLGDLLRANRPQKFREKMTLQLPDPTEALAKILNCTPEHVRQLQFEMAQRKVMKDVEAEVIDIEPAGVLSEGTEPDD